MAEPNVTELESADAKSLSALEAVISAAEELNQSSESLAQTTEDDASSVDDKAQETVEALTDSSVSEIGSPDRETTSEPVHDKPVSDKQTPNAETSPDDVRDDHPCIVASSRSEEHELNKPKTDSADSQSATPQSPSTSAPSLAMEEASDAEEDRVDATAEKCYTMSSLTPAEEMSPPESQKLTAAQLTPPKEETPSRTESDDTVAKKAPACVKSLKDSASSPRVRRSSRAISNTRTGAEESKDTPTRVASPSGRNTRSQNISEAGAKAKLSGQKSQTSPGKASDETAMEEIEKSEGMSLKRKAENVDEESNNATAPPAEKRSRKPVTALNTSALEASLLPESHFLSPPTPVPEGEQGKEEAKKAVTIHDAYCWACHTDGQVLPCAVCPRSYHQRCVQQAALSLQGWICPECTSVRNAEKVARASKGPKIEDLSRMLLYALQRVRSVTDCEPFMHEVDPDEVLNYSQYVVNPMDLSQLETKITNRSYASTRGFLADFRWILHNSIIFNSYQSKLTSVAKSLMKVCRHEMSEIDTCQDCYEHAHTKRDTWFLEPCSRPHLLIWAKLKGYPYWPAKAVKANKEGNVDVRFFGAHDRAWVPVRDCYLYSREVPASNKNKRKANFESSLAEIELHIERLTEMFGEFNYAPNKTPYNPSKEDEQLRLMIPNYKPREVTPPAPQPPAQVGAAAKKPKSTESAEKAEAKKEEKAASTAAASKSVEKLVPDNKSEPVMVVTSIEPDAPKAVSESDDAADKGNENSPSPSQDSNKFFSMLHLAPRSALPPPNTATNTKRPVITRMVIRNKNNPTSQPRFVQLSKAEYEKMRGSNSKKPLKVYIAKTIRSGAINSATSPTGLPKPVVVKTTTSLTTLPTSTKPVSSPPVQATPTASATVNPTPSPSPSPTAQSAPEKTTPAPPPTVQIPVPAVIKTEPMDVEEANETSPQEESSSNENAADKSMDEEKATATISSPLPEDDDDVNPAMYLDPTITITLLNQDDKLKSPNASPEKSHNLECDSEARNNVEETVSITLVPKKQPASGEKSATKGQTVAPKVTFSSHGEETPSSRVIEIDSPAPGLTTSTNATLTLVSKGNKTPAKARKSMARSPRAPPALAAQASKGNAVVPTKVPLPPLCKNAPANGYVNNGNGKGSSVASMKPATQAVQQQQFFQPFVEPSAGSASSQPVVSVVPGTASNSTLKTFTSGSGVEYVNAGGGYFLMTRPLSALQSHGGNVGVATATSSSTTSTISTSVPRLALTTGSEVGPISAFLHSKSQQIAEMIRSSLESLLQEAAASGSVEANLVQARLELERVKWNREKEVAEARRSAEALVKEVRENVEAENARQLSELRRQFEVEKKQAVEDAKSRQWCAECGKEAVFYCCWNTAYCDYPCQQEHWAKHMATCANASLSHGHSSSVTTADRERPSRPTSASDSSSNEARSPDKPGSKLAHYVQIPAARRAAQRKKARLYDNKRGASPEADDSSDTGLRVDASDEEDEPRSSKSPERAYHLKPKLPAPVTQPRRKRCGQCAGCLNTVSCGQCFACKTTNSHRICKDRLCLELKKQKLLRAKERARQLAAQANGKSGKGDKAGAGSATGKKIAPKPLIPPSRPDLGYSVIAPTGIASSAASNNVSEPRPLPPKAALPTPTVVVSNATNTNSSVVVTSSQPSMTTPSISTNALRFNPSALTGPVSFIVSSPKGGGNPKIEGVVLGSNQGGGTQTILSPENYMSLMASQNQGQQQQQQQQQPTSLPTITLPSLPLGSNATEMPAPMLTSTIAFSNNAPVLHYLRPVTQDKRDEK